MLLRTVWAGLGPHTTGEPLQVGNVQVTLGVVVGVRAPLARQILFCQAMLLSDLPHCSVKFEQVLNAHKRRNIEEVPKQTHTGKVSSILHLPSTVSCPTLMPNSSKWSLSADKFAIVAATFRAKHLAPPLCHTHNRCSTPTCRNCVILDSYFR